MLTESSQRRTDMEYRRRLWFWAVMCLAVVLATACGSGGSKQESTPSTESTTATTATTVAPAPAGPAAPAAAQITIDGFSYGQPITVSPGAKITVVNKDSAGHTVTSNTPGKFDADVPGNAQATFTAPNEAGSYPYHCNYHASMHGTLVVQ
jgi:plastocyanin